MKNALLYAKRVVIMSGFVASLILGIQHASASEPITPTAIVSPTLIPGVMVTVHGIACIDRDSSGVCGGDEARVPNVIVRNTDGLAAVSGNSGEFTIQAEPHSELDITIPSGYKSVNGNLHRFRIRMANTNTIDIALAIDSAYYGNGSDNWGIVAGEGAGSPQTDTSFSGLLPVNSNFLRLVLVVAIIVATLAVLLALRVLLHKTQRSYGGYDSAQRDQHTRDVTACLEQAEGWQLVAGQIAADILHKAVSVDNGAGILNAIADPSPRFSLVTLDRQEILFTTDPGILRKVHLIRNGDRIIDITARSVTCHTSIRMLWQHICTTRQMLNVVPPEATHWYMVVRFADNRPDRKRQYVMAQRMTIPRPKTHPYKPWRGPA